MKAPEVYLDYNATAPVRPAVIEAVAAALAQCGNPSSIHAAGRRARSALELGRAAVAALVGASPDMVLFTSGGTEANNQALLEGGTLASSIEHESVLRAAGEAMRLPVGQDGQADLAALDDLLDRCRPATVAVMLANNETGVIQPVAEIARLAHERGVRVHCDAVQAAGKIPVAIADLGVDSLSLSAHKLGGPQGVGALVVVGGADRLRPMLKGGSQEKRARPGTENLAGIVGFGRAAEEALQDLDWTRRVGGLRDRLEVGLLTIAPEASVFGRAAPRLPNTSCVTMPGVANQTQLMGFDLEGIAVSTGSACSSGKVASSPVLAAMGVPDDIAATAIRVSLGWASIDADVERFLAAYRGLYERKRERRPALAS